MRDSRWLARDAAYHAEAIKDLNNTVRKMVRIVPASYKRGLLILLIGHDRMRWLLQ